ncbi:hypothetical protein HY374_00805 [Candidatus Berkelbacteria bacterium]|nr:hypothetical protein [Candidatus Berkelbacteria bacterium]
MGAFHENAVTDLQATALVHTVMDIFSEEYNLRLPPDEYPSARLFDEVEFSTMVAGYSRRNNSIVLPRQTLQSSDSIRRVNLPTGSRTYALGDMIGEECGHALRRYFRQSALRTENQLPGPVGVVTHKSVDEFFGMLGRRLLAESERRAGHKGLFIDGDVRAPTDPERLLRYSQTLKRDRIRPTNVVNRLRLWLGDTGLSGNEIQERLETAAHSRGYKWALKLSLGRIKNWSTLFSLPPKEVQRRFFTNEPDYQF